MINKKYLKNLRCKGNNNKNHFIFDLYNERIIDSLDIIKLDFKKILILGNHGTKIESFIKKKYKIESISLFDSMNDNFDLDLWKEEIEKYDLIISNFYLFLSENLNNLLKKINNSLLPNGFFIATMPTKENFNSLKLAMIKTDIDLYGGAFNRFNKNIELTDIIDFLKKNQFNNPLVNLENINLEYKNFNQLLIDIRSMNLSYYYDDKKLKFDKKNYFKKLEKNFQKNLDNNYSLSTIFYIISGWKNHESQQRPLKPGQAKNNLKNFLK